MKGHSARQYSDEMQCGKCGKTWDVNDPNPPQCIDEPRKPLTAMIQCEPQSGATTMLKSLMTGYHWMNQGVAVIRSTHGSADWFKKHHIPQHFTGVKTYHYSDFVNQLTNGHVSLRNIKHVLLDDCQLMPEGWKSADEIARLAAEKGYELRSVVGFVMSDRRGL